MADTDYEKAKARVLDFLNEHSVEAESLDDEGSGKMGAEESHPYVKQMECLKDRKQVALYVLLDDVHTHDPELCEWIEENTVRFRRLFYEVIDKQLSEMRGEEQPPVLDALDAFIFQRLYMEKKRREQRGEMVEKEELRKRFPPELMRRYEIYFKARDARGPCSVRELKAANVGKLVSVRGTVIRCTELKPRACVITYTCDTCGCETYQPIVGEAYTPAMRCQSKDCLESKANGRLQSQIRGSKFTKYQEIQIQELADQVPIGGIPRSMSILVEGENTRKALPGDIITVSGVLIPMMKAGFRHLTGGLITEVYLEAQWIQFIENNRNEMEELMDVELTEEEVELLGREDLYEQLAYSIAPEIYGHVDVKKSLLLSLVGGLDKNANGMKIRGAVNVFLMGDPGVAKSQLLSYIDRLALRSQYTTGRGSSGVGLTAAVVRDTVTGEVALEGGSLVLADRGICCIDEFDKMVESDRTAIHEVMEQQTISIAKAGIIASLNARVSIIAAANPAYGRYNPNRSVEENIRLPAALLSRFDLIWLIQDVPDRESDKKLGDHIAYVHMHGEHPPSQFQPISIELFKKYLAICKRKQPVIPDALKGMLVNMYVGLRREALNSADSTFTSPRVLLAAIRMCTALARLRLSDMVELRDVEEAIRLTEASKASLHSTQQQGGEKPKDPLDAVYDVIRDMLKEASGEPLEMEKVYAKCNQRGFDSTLVDQCVERQSEQGVVLFDRDYDLIQAV